MFHSCCVVNCASRRKDVNLFVFPKTEIGLHKWLLCIRSDDLRSLTYQELRKRFVCIKHFEKRFISVTRQRVRLLHDAYPTLFTESEISNGVPEAPIIFSNTENIQHDHNYVVSMKRKHVDHTYCKSEFLEKRQKTGNVSSSNDADIPTSSQQNSTQDAVDYAIPCRTPTKIGRKGRKIIYKKKLLSPTCKKLYKIYQKSQRQLNFLKRSKKAIRFSQMKSFQNLTKTVNPIAKKFLWMQIEKSAKNPRGRRFTEEEKLIALSIMKQSPKCYKFLHKLFILPSKYTLTKYVSQMNVEVGINPQIFEAIKEEVTTWDEKKKFTSILFDEVSLETFIDYEKHKDSITGFVELNMKKNEFADHALVFMIRGVVEKWQQPLAYYFCKGATSAVDLKNILKDIIVAVGKANLIPIVLICDQGTAFQSTIKSLQEDTRRKQIKENRNIDDVIEVEHHTLYIIYDPPHLIKGLRNNFLTKNINLEGNLAKWSDIVDVYKTDCSHAQMRLLHKLNDEHVIPEKIKKMKVKTAQEYSARLWLLL